jgi:hypothetical protein
MQEQRKLVLHIGSHKTGSTTLQRTLFANRYHLLEQGWSLFCSTQDGEVSRRGNAGTWVSLQPGGGVVSPGFVDRLARSTGNVLVSSEGFSWLFGQSEVGQLGRQLQAHFDHIQVVAYIKRQDQMAVSHFQQASKNSPARKFYARGNRALPEYQPSYNRLLDYYERLSHWATAFGENNLTVRDSDRNVLVKGDAVDDFAYVTGLEFPVRLPWRNISNGFAETKVGHLMTQEYTPRHLRKPIEEVLEGGEKLMPSRSEAEVFYRHFRESNRALNKRFGISENEYLFSDDFTMYADAARDTWTEDSANDTLVKILSVIGGMMHLSKSDEKVFKKCAGLLLESDPDNAVLLMDLATRLKQARP